MEIGKVVGNVWATKKDEAISGQKLLVVDVVGRHSMERESLLVAADVIGAGIGDQVLICRGNSARMAVGDKSAPVDAAVIGIIDSLDIHQWDKRDGGTPNGY